MSKLRKITFGMILILAVVFMGVLLYLFVRPKEAGEAIAEPVTTDDLDDEIRVLSDRNEVMKEYICEQIGFGGMFTLTLYENGTFSYYEGTASSYFGYGDWLFEERQLTLFDKGTGTIRKAVLDYEKGDLIYNQQESDQYPFTYVQLEDGKRFVLKERADEEFYLGLELQLSEQQEEIRKRIMEAEKSNPLDYITLKSFVGRNVEGTLCIDASENAVDKQMPITIKIINRDNKILWESLLGIQHMAWNSFYMYSEDGVDYVIEYNPEESQGQPAYTFRMFTLNEQGEKVVSCEYFASSEEGRDAFYRNVNPYLQKASLLISTIGGDIRY